MAFALKGQILFTAPIDRSNTTYLSGTVIPPQTALVSASSTLPLNETLWHRRFAHFHHAGIQRIVSESLVTGLKLQSSSKVDPICEPCLSGKLNAAPFPPSRPLALVHSVHCPLPVRTLSEYRNDNLKFKVTSYKVKK